MDESTNKENEFFVTEKKPNKKIEIQESSGKKIIPRDYIPIKLNSLGKLHAPAILHVRNYNMEDALQLSLVDEESALETTIGILDKMFYESFDPVYLHLDELKEILLTIYTNFWSTTLISFPYPYEDEELEKIEVDLKKKILSGKKDVAVDIPIDFIKTNSIHSNFKEPIKITIKEKEVYFRLSRIKDILDAKKYIEQKYLTQEKEFSNFKEQLESGNDENVPDDIKKRYLGYQKARNFDLVKTIQAQVLIKVFGKKLNTLNEKIKYYTKVGIKFWKAYNDVVEKYATFGINPEIKIKSPLTNEIVIRRFQFRYLDFLRALDIQGHNEYTVSFGE